VTGRDQAAGWVPHVLCQVAGDAKELTAARVNLEQKREGAPRNSVLGGLQVLEFCQLRQQVAGRGPVAWGGNRC